MRADTRTGDKDSQLKYALHLLEGKRAEEAGHRESGIFSILQQWGNKGKEVPSCGADTTNAIQYIEPSKLKY